MMYHLDSSSQEKAIGLVTKVSSDMQGVSIEVGNMSLIIACFLFSIYK
jgi:hypothetical protein